MQSEQEHDVFKGSSWRKCYWFARMLLNTDQYGAAGKNNSMMRRITDSLEDIVWLDDLTADERCKVCMGILRSEICGRSSGTSRAANQRMALLEALEEEIFSLDDIFALIVTIKYIVLPTNDALARVPSDDNQFCQEKARYILNAIGKGAVGKVVKMWDKLGVRGCIDVERSEIITSFTLLRRNLENFKVKRSEADDNAILTAFVQEFERRAGQKRKSRAGTSLEDITTFLFDYYKLASHPKPDHFQTDIEVDKWFKCTDGWLIGISCKRTLRERWKQVSSADSNALSRYKIKEIWHMITYDKDLSDDKLTMLGQQRQVFYLSDESDRFKTASAHIGMRDYVRPLSALIDDIAKEQGRTINA